MRRSAAWFGSKMRWTVQNGVSFTVDRSSLHAAHYGYGHVLPEMPAGLGCGEAFTLREEHDHQGRDSNEEHDRPEPR